MSQTSEYVEAILSVSNLEEDWAKVILNYCVMTWSDIPRIRPLIDIHGESGTGKSGLMRQIFPWCREPYWVNGLSLSVAMLRNELANKCTVFIQEADKVQQLEEAENWLQQRYEESPGQVVRFNRLDYDQKTGRNVTVGVEARFHGYTFMHTQGPFKRTETERRILRVALEKDSGRSYQQVAGLSPALLGQIASEVDWTSVPDLASASTSWDTWLDIARVSAHLGDEHHCEWILTQAKAKQEQDDQARLFEPKYVVLSELIPHYLELMGKRNPRLALADLRVIVLQNRGLSLVERQISDILFGKGGLGFARTDPQGKAHIRIEGIDKLIYIASKCGISREDILGEEKPENESVKSSIAVSSSASYSGPRKTTWDPCGFRP